MAHDTICKAPDLADFGSAAFQEIEALKIVFPKTRPNSCLDLLTFMPLQPYERRRATVPMRRNIDACEM
jgi:hypothetical protein